ncbi:hypothetical protein [Streptococcus sp. sy004]|uniref:hypothetical protein n=1 Tax=Streptococcus sp. sy004 TaxID=2600149 RepID=UPI0011B62513|nr:hypothetical protein [Streptococcus sp. sy004]TWT12085.1 hypothetical protein FRX54_00720 [Streptococcus sp. sy004]
MNLLDLITAYAPTIGVIATAFFGYKASSNESTGKLRFEELKSNLITIKSEVDKVKEIGHQNNQEVKEVNDKLELHDESHLVVLYNRLKKDIGLAVSRGYTTSEEFNFISRMYTNYQALGGNGYISKLYEDFTHLSIKEEHYD